MSDDIGVKFQLSIMIFLLAGLASSVITLMAVELAYTRNTTDKYMNTLTDLHYKDLASVVANSYDVPATGPSVYKVAMNAGGVFEKIIIKNLARDNNGSILEPKSTVTESITIYSIGYEDGDMVEFIEKFMVDYTDRYYVLSLSEIGYNNLYTLTAEEVLLHD